MQILTIFKSLQAILLLLAILSLTSACKDDDIIDDDTVLPSYSIPTTYNFDNVNYSGQTQRLGMLLEMKAYMATASNHGAELDADRLKGMFANDVSTADWDQSYDSSKTLKDKTLEAVQTSFEGLMEAMAMASLSTEAGSIGTAGVINSTTDDTKQYLIGATGLDYAQLIEKGLMGATFYYQSTAIYFGDEKMNADNETVTVGKGTEMEHHWDEAFGYLGVSKDFPSNTDALFFWGNYSNQRDEILDCNQTLMDAFLKGRAAISNDDLATRDEAISEARESWELITVGSALHYINEGIALFDDLALRGHGLSEAIGFIYGLQFNPDKKINNTQVEELLSLVAGAADFADMNLYQAEITKLLEAKDKLAEYYDLEDKKDLF